MTIVCFFIGHDLQTVTREVTIPIRQGWRIVHVDAIKTFSLCKRCGKIVR